MDDYVTVANTGSDFSTVPFTWTAWVKADQLPSAAAQNKNIVIMGHSSAPWTAYEIWADDAGNVFKWTVRDSGGTARTVVADSALVANRWYHIAAILDSNYKSRLYIDGVLQSQTQSNASLFAPNSNLILGGNSSTNQGWDGPIDDIRFYKRALSPGEVKALYDSTKPIQFIRQTGLTANGETTPHSASFSTLPSVS